MPITEYLLLSAFLFCTGVYGVLARRNGVLVLMSVELMLNAVNINLVAFARFHGDLLGLVFTLFTIAITVAEVAVGLAIVIVIFRVRRTVEADRPTCSGADVMDANVWLPILVLGLPFASFVLLAVVAPLRRAGGAAGAVSIAAIAAAFLGAVVV